MAPSLDQIVNAPEQQVRTILLALCNDDGVRQRAVTHYDTLQPGTSGEKRKAAYSLFICLQCGEPFEKEDNVQGDCRYHPGHRGNDRGEGKDAAGSDSSDGDDSEDY
ncbi:hypothetical protein QQZ08_011885 [Neonectria magnoliae]|uniref:C2H2-type domain-containing protein n=1 Tax=Neonectria magnoliae TaxID=2732573 RepID=A0ABR1H6S9_9HYPO